MGRYRPGLIFCEMVKIEALVRNNARTYRYLDRHARYASHRRPDLRQQDRRSRRDAAKIIEDLGFDVIDLNCGCPVDKVIKDGSGSGLLRNPGTIGEIVSAMVSAVRIPVTVKIRSGWDERQINAPLSDGHRGTGGRNGDHSPWPNAGAGISGPGRLEHHP